MDHLVTSEDNYYVPFIDDYNCNVQVSFLKTIFTLNMNLLIFGHTEGDYSFSNPFTNLRANERTKHNQSYTSHSIGVAECLITQLFKQFGKLS